MIQDRSLRQAHDRALRQAALAIAALLVVAAPAAAEPTEEASEPRFFTRSQGEEAPEDRPSVLHPIHSVFARAFPIAGLGVWAQGQGFAVSRRAALYDLEGGAALLLDEGVHLTASYRMLGIDLGFDSDVKAADGEPGIAAPFLGLAFDF